MRRAALIRVTGVVQGVGFRPFVYRLAVKLGLNGYVQNLGGSEVEIWVEGDEKVIEEFLRALKLQRPPPAELDGITVAWVQPKFFETFAIKNSGESLVKRSQIPPDIGVCPDCLREITDPTSRWYRYSFNSCAWCGPRFSMMYRAPYDRENTSMNDFPLCEECLQEYKDSENARRFHAQGISCPKCGPRLTLVDAGGKKIPCDDPLREAALLIEEGSIVAVKGLGGFHLASLASNDDVVMKLRERKHRPQKPFAIMALDVEVVKRIADPAENHIRLLISPHRPIVLIPKREGSPVSELVAPGLSELGVMLPYTPLHFLLLNETRDKFLIMTSGNRSGLPICKGEEALVELRGIADYFVLHNRKIVNRVDDSVVRITDGEPQLIRRARGYAPKWFNLPFQLGSEAVALGAHLDNAGAVAFEDKVVLTQYVGDMDNLENVEFLLSSIDYLLANYRVEPKVVASDKHPRYVTSELAETLSRQKGIPHVKVQHHHAHIVSAMASRGLPLDSEVVGIAMDGVGYGDDGRLWGGEVMLATYRSYERVGHLEYLPLPGGDRAAVYPARIVVRVLAEKIGFDEALIACSSLSLDKTLPGGRLELEAAALSNKTYYSSSVGRFLDAVSALLGVCGVRTYEGEPAVKLEAAARGGALVDKLKIEVQHGTVLTSEFISSLLDARDSYSVRDLAYTCLTRLGEALAELVLNKIPDQKPIVIAGGGAAVNDYIIKGLRRVLGKVLLPIGIPPGDGGIALGQAVVAALEQS
ncbi:MAG: carbamoyltransferase HypF [Thermofilaceae archaeon]